MQDEREIVDVDLWKCPLDKKSWGKKFDWFEREYFLHYVQDLKRRKLKLKMGFILQFLHLFRIKKKKKENSRIPNFHQRNILEK